MILFVCTGNICRSPMAEELFRKLLIKAGQRGNGAWAARFAVASAGVSAALGEPASRHSVSAVKTAGGDLSRFASQPLTEGLIARAAHIFVMTQGHLDVLLTFFPTAAEKAHLLTEFQPGPDRGADIADPFGQGPEVYNRCRDQIRAALPSILEWLERGGK